MKSLLITIIVIAVAVFLPIPAYQSITTCTNDTNCTTESKFVLGSSIFQMITQNFLK